MECVMPTHGKGLQSMPGLRNGGAEEDRTPDLLNAIQALSQLSYDPTNAASNARWGAKESIL